MKKRINHLFLIVSAGLLALLDMVKAVHAGERGAVDLNRLMWLGAGAGSKGIVAGMVGGLAPQAGIAPDMVGAFVGFWLAQQGGRWMSPFGEGMLIASVGQLVRQPIEGIFGQIGKGGTTPPPGGGAEAAAAAAALAAKGTPAEDIDAYLAKTYGIV